MAAGIGRALERGCFGVSYGIRYVPGIDMDELTETAGISLSGITVLPSAQGFAHEWKLVFSANGNNTAFDALWILLLCEYPHHLLCGICQSLA